MRLVDGTLDLLQSGTPYELTLQMLHADGGRRWVIRNGEAVRNEYGDIVELGGTVQEISEGLARTRNAEGHWLTTSIAEDSTGRLVQAQEKENKTESHEDYLPHRIISTAGQSVLSRRRRQHHKPSDHSEQYKEKHRASNVIT